MKRSELTEFAVEEEGFKLKIRRGTNGFPIVSSSRGSNPPFGNGEQLSSQSGNPAAPNGGNTVPPMNPGASNGGSAPAAEEAGVSYIKSPMVGTFYRAASPESKPFADAGTKVV